MEKCRQERVLIEAEPLAQQARTAAQPWLCVIFFIASAGDFREKIFSEWINIYLALFAKPFSAVPRFFPPRLFFFCFFWCENKYLIKSFFFLCGPLLSFPSFCLRRCIIKKHLLAKTQTFVFKINTKKNLQNLFSSVSIQISRKMVLKINILNL